MRKTKLAIGLSVSLVGAALLIACSGGEQGMPPPPQVNVAQVVQKKVQLWDEFSGRIEAVETVELRPRVSGYLAAVHFGEGSAANACFPSTTVNNVQARTTQATSLA